MSLKDFLKHPKTRRIIAVEWLVLVSFVCVSAAIALFVEMPRKLDKYWADLSEKQEEQYRLRKRPDSGRANDKTTPTLQELYQGLDIAVKNKDAKAGGTLISAISIVEKNRLSPPNPLPMSEALVSAEKLSGASSSEPTAPPEAVAEIPEVTRTSKPTQTYRIEINGRKVDLEASSPEEIANNYEELKKVIPPKEAAQVAEPTAPHESGSAKKSRRSTADTFKALWFALSESFATAALAGVLFGVLGYLAAWFPRFTFRAIRVVLANRPPP